MPSRFTQYGGALGAEQALQEMIAQKLAAQKVAFDRAVEMHKLSQGDEGLSLEGGRLTQSQNELGQRQKEYTEAAPMRDAQTGYLRTQTRDLEQKPLYAEQDYQRDLGKIKATGDQQVRAAGVRQTADQGRLVQVEGPDGRPVWKYEREAVNQPVANAPRQPTGADRNTLNFFRRMVEAERNARAVEDKLGGRDLAAQQYAPGWLENWLQSSEGQAYTQAQRMYTEARLRKESGAAIPQSEFDTDRKTNFRIAGDSPELLAQKRRSRLETMRGIGNAAGRGFQEFYGDNQNLDDLLSEFEDKNAPVAMVAPDGRPLSVPPEKVAEMEARGAKRK